MGEHHKRWPKQTPHPYVWASQPGPPHSWHQSSDRHTSIPIALLTSHHRWSQVTTHPPCTAYQSGHGLRASECPLMPMTGNTAACVAYFSTAWSCDSAVFSSPCVNVGRRECGAAADTTACALLAVTRLSPLRGIVHRTGLTGRPHRRNAAHLRRSRGGFGLRHMVWSPA
jgi:hypothetical protein